MVTPYTVPWVIVLPSFLGALVLISAATWVVARWALRRHLSAYYPEIAKTRIAILETELDAAAAELTKALSSVSSSRKREAAYRARLRGIAALVAEEFADD